MIILSYGHVVTPTTWVWLSAQGLFSSAIARYELQLLGHGGQLMADPPQLSPGMNFNYLDSNQLMANPPQPLPGMIFNYLDMAVSQGMIILSHC